MSAAGILGLGYLGWEIQRIFDSSRSSWFSIRSGDSVSPEIESCHKMIRFDWEDSLTWINIPNNSVHIVLTIPPVLKDRDREKKRVEAWCCSTNKNR